MTDSADGDAPEPTRLTPAGAQAADDAVSPGSSTTADTDTDQPAATPPGPTPGNLDDLSPERLAATGQWIALAALARHGEANDWGQRGLAQLVLHADDPVAFTWMWATLQASSSPQAWLELSHLPRPLRVPTALVQDVGREAASPLIAATPRSQAMMHLLRALDPADPGTSRIARAVLDRERPAYDEQANEAIRLLGASRDPAVRTVVLELADAAAKHNQPETRRRAELIAALSWPLLGADELRATQDAADALTAHQPWRPDWARAHAPWAWPLLKTLVVRLPADHLAQLINQPWVTDVGDGSVADELFQVSFAAEVLEELLDRAMSFTPTVRAALVKSLATRPDPQGRDLIEYAHHVVPLAELSALHSELVDQVDRSRHLGMQRRAQALQRLQTAALAVPRAQPADMGQEAWLQVRHSAALEHDAGLQAWTAVLAGGEISQVAVHGLSQDQLRHLGAAAGMLLRQKRFAGTADSSALAQAEGDVLQLLENADDTECSALLAGLCAAANGLLPDSALRHALWAGAHSTTVVAAATAAPTTALYLDMVDSNRTTAGADRVHSLDWRRWRSERALDLLESVPLEAASISTTGQLVAQLPWADLSELGLLQRAVRALATKPTLFAGQLQAAVTGLSDPVQGELWARRLPMFIDQVLADPALSASLTTGIGLEAADLIRTILDVGGEDLERAGQHWLLTAAPTPEIVKLAVDSDQASALKPSPYAAARQAHGRTLCQQALDTSQQLEPRLKALHLAAHADDQQAHRAAATLLTWHLDRRAALPTTMRRQVADVFAATPAAPEDADLGERLLAGERDAAVARSVRQALRRLRSETWEDVLASLLGCAGVSADVGPLNPVLCTAQAQWRDRMRTHVDELQRLMSVQAPPRTVVHQMTVLSDLLSEHAIASLWDAKGTDKEKARAVKLRDNTQGKDDIGFIATNQQLQQELKWLSSQSTLHDMRNGHAAPRGSTRARDITDHDAVVAQGLLGHVVIGWAQQLYDAAGQQLPDGTP